MMRHTTFQAASQSQAKRKSSGGWYGFIRSAIVAGFESYGLAQMGLPPRDMPVINPGAEVKDGSATVAVGNVICSQPVAKVQIDPVLSVRVHTRKSAVDPAWRHA